MEKKFRITVEGKQYIVAVEDISADGAQTLYPEPSSMNLAPAPVLNAPAPATPSPTSSPTPPPGASAGPGDEVAPLGGVVQTIHVNVGQAVNEGDKLISLEAMKMVTYIVARRGGKVISIAVKPGDPVDAGQALLTIG